MSCFGNYHVSEEDGDCILDDGTICEECGYLEYKIHKSHVNNETLYQLINGEITYEEFINITKSQQYSEQEQEYQQQYQRY